MIEFRNVCKTYDTGTEAVHNANFKINKGDFAFLVGSSGSGKSTGYGDGASPHPAAHSGSRHTKRPGTR